MQGCQHLLLQFAVEIDEHVAAGDQIDPAERRILEHAVACEQHGVAQFALGPVELALAREEAAQPLFAEIGLDGDRIAPFARNRERARVHVRRKHLNFRPHLLQRRLFQQKHRDGIGFFSGCAAHHPDAQRLLLFRLLDNRGDRKTRQSVEGLRIAKEGRHRDQQIGQQVLGFVRAFPQIGKILLKGIRARHLHPALDAAQHRRALVE